MAISLPSGENATDVMPSESLSKRRISLAVRVSHSRAVRSAPPVSTWRPSGEMATEATISECPWKVWTSRPVAASQSRAVRSELPVRTRRPSGENATEEMPSEWPSCGTKRGAGAGPFALLVWDALAFPGTVVCGSAWAEPAQASDTRIEKITRRAPMVVRSRIAAVKHSPYLVPKPGRSPDVPPRCHLTACTTMGHRRLRAHDYGAAGPPANASECGLPRI